MLPIERIDEVMQLLAAGGLSQRQIAKRTGVSRVVIHRLATGKRKPRPEPENTDWGADRPTRPFERCSICGGLVQFPCLACIVKRLVGKNVIRDEKMEPLGLELEGDHYKRYLEVRSWRERQDNPDFSELPEAWPF